MNIRRAGRKVVKNQHKEYGIYRIGFVNIYGEEDETEYRGSGKSMAVPLSGI